MVRVRLQAATPIGAFAAFASVLAFTGHLPLFEAGTAIVGVIFAFGYSGWIAPAGWRRRGSELALLVLALALLFVNDPTMRRMAFPPLLLAVSCLAFAAAVKHGDHRTTPWLVVNTILAVRCAGLLGLTGYEWWQIVLVIAVIGSLAFTLTRHLGWNLALPLGLLTASAPVEKIPVFLLLVILVLNTASILVPVRSKRTGKTQVVIAIAMPVCLVMVCFAPWGGQTSGTVSPFNTLVPALILGTAAVVGSFVGTMALGVLVFIASLCLGTVSPPPPDMGGVVLDATHPASLLPPSQGGPYLVEIALGQASHLSDNTEVGYLQWNDQRRPIRVGIETSEWAHERFDVKGGVKHGLPTHPVWRPAGEGRSAFFGVAGRVMAEIPPGVQPLLQRRTDLDPQVSLGVATAGPSRATPPRNLTALGWIIATGIAILLIQLLGQSWNRATAWIPWILLATWRLALQLPVEPLRVLLERHAVDLCLLAFLAAWLPIAWVWLGRKRHFAAAVTLLLPLALAAPQLAPPGVDERYHTTILRSITEDFDLDLSNNYQLETHPENQVLVNPKLVHSPVLATSLSPGFLLAGRTGALAILACLGAALLAVCLRVAASQGLQRERSRLLALVLMLSYPLATFSTQMWVEIPGALASACCLLLVIRGIRGQRMAAGLSALAASIKTRLGLATFPILLAEFFLRRSDKRRLVTGAVIVGVAVSLGLGAGLLFFGHALGPLRRFEHLFPTSAHLAVVVLGGLLFDPAGGLALSTPLALFAIAAMVVLWRKAQLGVRGLILGLLATLFSLMGSPEWYGGGSPPARYLVPFFPVFALAGVALLKTPCRWRRFSLLCLPASLLVWFALTTRPHFTYNPGDGGWWLTDLVAVDLGVDTRHLIPSFLRPNNASWLVPLLLGALLALLYFSSRCRGLVTIVSRESVTLTLVVATVFIAVAVLRCDRVVEIEDPQVEKIGGLIEPPPGTFSRFTYPNGWRIGGGESVIVPLNLPDQGRLFVEGWLEGEARKNCSFLWRWDQGREERLILSNVDRGRLPIPFPGKGRHRLELRLEATSRGEAVLDRIQIER